MTNTPSAAVTATLSDLLWAAGLPAAVALQPLRGRGFDNELLAARLADGRQVVLRRRRTRGEPEHTRARFLEAHGLPAPRLLAGNGDASLHEFVPGELLGDLIEAGRATPAVWEQVGAAVRRVHAVGFPAHLEGALSPDLIVLRPCDPVADLHASLEAAIPGLARRAPAALEHLAALHDLVDRAAAPLRDAPTALLHGDPGMWNIIMDQHGAVLIDWDRPLVGDPARELALLDMQAMLFNGQGLDPAFYRGYARPAPQPNTALQRVLQTFVWAGSDDWDSACTQPPPEQSARAQRWLQALLADLARLPAQIAHLRTLL